MIFKKMFGTVLLSGMIFCAAGAAFADRFTELRCTIAYELTNGNDLMIVWDQPVPFGSNSDDRGRTHAFVKHLDEGFEMSVGAECKTDKVLDGVCTEDFSLMYTAVFNRVTKTYSRTYSTDMGNSGGLIFNATQFPKMQIGQYEVDGYYLFCERIKRP